MKNEKYIVEFVYLGERIINSYSFNGVEQIFRNKKGKVAKYKNVRGLYFGQSYLISKDGFIINRNPPQPAKQTVFSTEQEKLDFEIHKELIKDFRLRKKKAITLKKPHPDIIKALNLLKPFTRNLDLINLKRFADYLQNQLLKKSKKI